jgi:hypothetical protein
VFVDYLEDLPNEFIALVVGEFAQGDVASPAEVGGFVGVATGAAQRALAGDFDGQGRSSARENGLPRLHDMRGFHGPPDAGAWLKES